MPVVALRALQMLAASFVALIVAGCESAVPPPIDVRAIGQVQAEIKKQVGMYVLAARTAPVLILIDGKYTDIRGRKELFWCGSGNIDFDVSAVKAGLTTSLDTSAGFNFALTPPAPIPASGSFGFSRGARNSQALDYNLWPLEMSLQGDAFLASETPTEEDLSAAPIAQVLLSLRQAQITGATRTDYVTGVKRPPQPCFTNYDPAKPAADAGHTFTIGLKITTTVKGEISVGVSAVKIGASVASTTETGHTLKVTFMQRGLAVLQALRDRVDAECKYPNVFREKCKAATVAYNQLRVDGEIGESAWATLLPPGTPRTSFPPNLDFGVWGNRHDYGLQNVIRVPPRR